MDILGAKSVSRRIRPFACFGVMFFLGISSAQNSVGRDVAKRDVRIARETIRSRLEASSLGSGSGPACGVYASCRAAMLLGESPDPSDFFTAKYIVDTQGSMPANLLTILNSFRLSAEAKSNLSKADLVVSGLPVIANVRQVPDSCIYDHWVCAIVRDGTLFVYDGPSQGVETGFDEFLSVWNGYGIVVRPEYDPGLAAIWIFRVVSIAALALVGHTVWHRIGDKINHVPFRYFTILLACLALAIVGQILNGDLLGYSNGIRRAVACRSIARVFPETETSEIDANKDLTLVIDARNSLTYRAGALPGAINIPVDTSLGAIRGLTEGIDRAIPIAVYCHSNRCEYDRVVANKLAWAGFENVSVSSDGWVEYSVRKSDQGVEK